MKVNRADVEWLLATYEDSFTPQTGLDVRGADLDGVDLSRLPLIGLCGGLTIDEWESASEEQRKIAEVHGKYIQHLNWLFLVIIRFCLKHFIPFSRRLEPHTGGLS